MLRKEINGIVCLEFELFQQFPSLRHSIFLKHGGESQGQFHSLNLSFNVGDNAAAVAANEQKVFSTLNLKQITRGKLTHGKEIASITPDNLMPTESCDGLVTRMKHVGLLVTHADCQAAIFYDPVTHSLATVHAGWRGSVQNIYAETLEQMKTLYGSCASNIHVGISPSLGPEAAEFINYKTELPAAFWEFQIKSDYFDFWEISRQQLLQAGILGHHIEIANLCTYNNPQDYFSYRRDKVTGRHATVAALL